MKRLAPTLLALGLALVAACGSAPTRPVSRPAAVRPRRTVAAPTVEIAGAAAVINLPTTFIAFYGDMVQPPGRPAPFARDFAAGSTVLDTDVACQVERLAKKPPHATCMARPHGAQATDGAEVWFRERFAACFHVTHALPSRATLTALEHELAARTGLPQSWPDTSASFVTLSVHVRETQYDPVTEPVGCEGVSHPCDPVLRQTTRTIERIVERDEFAAYGPHEYTFVGGVSPRNLFPQTGAKVVYARVEVSDHGGPLHWDPLFSIANPPLSWHDAVRETYARLAPLVLGEQSDVVELALALDRAVFAYQLGDDASGKRWQGELEAWLGSHRATIPDYAREDFARTRETLSALARGAFSTRDPCGK